MSSWRGAPFWNIFASVAAAAWTVLLFMVDRRDHLLQESEAKQIREEQSLLEQRTRLLQDMSSRQHDQLAMLPSTVQLLRDQRCDSDFVALVLLDEMRGYLDDSPGPAPARIGVKAQRAALKLLIARQATGRYCSCETLSALGSLQTRDADVAELAAELAHAAEANECRTGPVSQVLAQVQTNAARNDYYVVLSNDTDCAEAQVSFRRAARALAKGLPDKYDPRMLQLLAGKYRGKDYLVTAYGGKLDVRSASDIIARAEGAGGVRNDLYWAPGITYQPQAACPSPDARVESQPNAQAQALAR